MRQAAGGLVAGLVAAAALAPAVQADSFAFQCKPSHRLKDDPIVSYGEEADHDHDFFGNRSTNRFSTRDSLYASSPGLCFPAGDETADRSAYWFPTLYQLQQDGTFKAINPNYSTVYYRAPVDDLKSIKPFPQGLKVIAGDAKAQSPQPRGIVDWMCYDGDMDASGPAPYCHSHPGKRATLRMKLVFPSCSDGREHSPDHKSHMAYPTPQRKCPATHPTPVPKIEMFTYYLSAGGPDADKTLVPGAVKLSSGGHYSTHGDFFEAWDQVKLNYLIVRCLMWNQPGCVT